MSPVPDYFNVLAVDDDALILRLVEVACRPFDLKVTMRSANTVHAAIDLAKKTKFQLLVLDHDVAGIKGWELYDYLKQWLDPKVQIVVYSGSVDANAAAKYKERGIDNILKKPLSANTLGFWIRKAIGI
jgi:CheY-like chemotaxis protein